MGFPDTEFDMESQKAFLNKLTRDSTKDLVVYVSKCNHKSLQEHLDTEGVVDCMKILTSSGAKVIPVIYIIDSGHLIFKKKRATEIIIINH